VYTEGLLRITRLPWTSRDRGSPSGRLSFGKVTERKMNVILLLDLSQTYKWAFRGEVSFG
jgi:hypothetical protein